MRFLATFDVVIMDGHPIFWVEDVGVAGIHHNQNIGCYYTIEDGQNKKSHLVFSFLVRNVLFLHFISRICLSKYYNIISLASFE